MLSGVLHSPRAIAVDVEIMRAFVRMRQMIGSHEDLAVKLHDLEATISQNFEICDQAIADIFKSLHELMNPPVTYAIGFTADLSSRGPSPEEGRAA